MCLIGFLLDDHGVAGRHQDAVHQIERLQRSGRDQDFIGVANDTGGAIELFGEKFAQRPIAERTAGEAIGSEVAALPVEHIGHRLDQPGDRNVRGIVVAADEIILGEAVPSRYRRRQPRRQQWYVVERSHARFSLVRSVAHFRKRRNVGEPDAVR